jgi:CDP-paratose 2-epimerase
MQTIIVTGSSGLIGNEAARFFHARGFRVAGIDNDMRAYFFGDNASTRPTLAKLKKDLPGYIHYNTDIRNYDELVKIFSEYNSSIAAVIHTAAQPSHDWAAREPLTDFSINATGTLNMLEVTRAYCPNAVFIFTSTNKVYGDSPNFLPLIETETRWEVDPSHPYALHGIDETMSIDNSKHSVFGASKVAADVMVQEYGKYFGMNTGIFRGGCLTGPAHAGAELHGFLAYLILCTVHNKPYKIFGYKGKQVRDNIHSKDLINAFWEFFNAPRQGEVYNMGGSRFANISMLEAIKIIESVSGNKLNYTVLDEARSGDHIWYVSDVRKFQQHYPNWKYEYDMTRTITEMVKAASTPAIVK